jgi:hypothetical protein
MIFMTSLLFDDGPAGKAAALTACRRWLTFSPTSEEKARIDRPAVVAVQGYYACIFNRL